MNEARYFAYKPLGTTSPRTNAVSTADRPLGALVAACASYSKGEPQLGTAKFLTQEQALAAAEEYACSTYDVKPQHFRLWIHALSEASHIENVHMRVAHMELSAYQYTAVCQLRTAGGVLALDCGLGKTVTTLAAIRSIFDHYGIPLEKRMTTISCPLNAMPTWISARRMEGLQAEHGTIRVASMDSLHKVAMEPDLVHIVVFDEAHNLGEAGRVRTGHAHRLRSKALAGLCLTGTLLHGGAHKVLSVLDLAIPGMSGFTTMYSLGEHFHCLVRKKLGARSVTTVERPTGANYEAFKAWLSQWVVSMSVNSPVVREELSLPEHNTFDQIVGLPWIDPEATVVAAVHAAVERGEAVPTASSMAHLLARDGAEAKVNWLLNQLMEDDEPFVVFAAYLDTLDKLEDALKTAGITFIRVDGSVTGPHREMAERAFQNGTVRGFIGQLHASSVAMNLQRSRVTVSLDHTWSATDYSQSLARTWRRGQERQCTHIDVFANAFQKAVVSRLRQSQDFNASVSEWQDVRRTVARFGCTAETEV